MLIMIDYRSIRIGKGHTSIIYFSFMIGDKYVSRQRRRRLFRRLYAVSARRVISIEMHCIYAAFMMSRRA